MTEKLVLYKLVKFGNGHITPQNVYEGGVIWSKGAGLEDTVFVGKVKTDGKSPLPEGVLEAIEPERLEAKRKERDAETLKNYKKRMYSKHADPLFIEAMRDKTLGDSSKWDKYVELCGRIKALSEIPAYENFI